MEVTLLQTLDDRDNPDEVETFGPYPGRDNTSWLGRGFYFWDTHLELAHWWGKFGYADSYVICEADAELNEGNCFDLHSIGAHRKMFDLAIDEMLSSGIVQNKESLLVPQVIEYLKRRRNWTYSAIRALGTKNIERTFRTIGLNWKLLRFDKGDDAFLDLYPPVQICIITKRGVNLRNFRIIYPDHYCSDYVVI